MERPITIVQIAKECGVSIATVSRVMNHTAPVSEATRARVNAVIQQHNYTPNAFARSLISRQSMTIGVVMPDISNPYFSAMFSEFEKAAHQAAYSVFLCNTSFSAATAEETTQWELQCFQTMLDKKVDGLLVAGGQADLIHISEDYKAALRRLAAAVPVVVLGNPIVGADCLFIQRERGQGVFSAISHLASLGHQRIAFVGGEIGVGITEERLQAYQDALYMLHLPQ
ncbi:MAG: LacI family DNA-binding transcriptional regulator, partial [Gemmiger sp.]|nr:LacI family DNA-binding transcriptional regulator [Gemmiger sp.]